MPHIKLLLVNLKKTKPENIFLGISNWNQVEDNSLINTNSCSASLAKMAVNSESGALWLHPLCFVLLWNCISENKLTLVWFCPLFFLTDTCGEWHLQRFMPSLCPETLRYTEWEENVLLQGQNENETKEADWNDCVSVYLNICKCKERLFSDQSDKCYFYITSGTVVYRHKYFTLHDLFFHLAQGWILCSVHLTECRMIFICLQDFLVKPHLRQKRWGVEPVYRQKWWEEMCFYWSV